MAYYTVKCCAAKSTGSAFYSFPLGARISGGRLEKRLNTIQLPYVDGVVDTGDGTLGAGDVKVSGTIFASSGSAAIVLIAVMEAALLNHADVFYVCAHWGSGETVVYYPVIGCKSVAHTQADGPGGKWIDIDVAFERGPDPDMST